MFWSGFLPDDWLKLLRYIIDFTLICTVIYGLLLIIRERRTLWMVKGLFVIMILTVVTQKLKLVFLTFFLEKLILVSALSIALVFQSDFRRFLEQLGKGKINQLFPPKNSLPKENNVMDEIVEAVKDLSQNRTGALILMETINTIEERVFINKGVYLNADVSRELLQTIFQTQTLLHDGAVFIRGSEIVSAGVILPLSERNTSQQLGTRHRAAMGITEKLHNCICIVVSEETGSISLGEKGLLNRPLTSIKLKELLEQKLSISKEKEPRITNQISVRGWHILKRLLPLNKSDLRKK